MRNVIAPVKNIELLSQAGRTLQDRAVGVPGIGLVWGYTGFGKTTAAAWFANQVNAIYLRACATWTPSALLSALMRELDAPPMTRCSSMLELAVERLAVGRRPLLVDEADYVMQSKRLVDTLRDLHDLSSVPLILIGMHDFRRKVTHKEQLSGRVAQWVEFKAADLEDARTLADTKCEVEIADDLLATLHEATRGSMRGLVVGLGRIEEVARRLGKQRVTLKDWGRGDFTLAHSTESAAA